MHFFHGHHCSLSPVVVSVGRQQEVECLSQRNFLGLVLVDTAKYPSKKVEIGCPFPNLPSLWKLGSYDIFTILRHSHTHKKHLLKCYPNGNIMVFLLQLDYLPG